MCSSDLTDYELEIEYTSEHEKDAQAILKILRDMLTRRKCFLIYKEGIADPPKVPSKSNRFFERMSTTKAASQASAFAPSKSYNSTFDYSDPDDYMHGYFGSMMPDESVCLSCGNFDGFSCHFPSGSCYYEHY